MVLLNKLLGFRWSLYIVENENELLYAMHCHSVLKIIGYVMGFFANGGKPVEPWSLYLNFNHNHQNIKLGPEYFTHDGEYTQALILQIESIDPGWRAGGDDIIFVVPATGESLKIREPTEDWVRATMRNTAHEVTFFSVMRNVFGKDQLSNVS